MRVLVFLWHLSGARALTSGGLRRFVELVSRGERYSIKFTVIENHPPLKSYMKTLNYEAIEFRMPLERYEDLVLIRFFLWVLFMLKSIVYGIRAFSRYNFDIVMTPAGELFCTAIPAFVIHLLRRIPLVYVVQLTPSGLPFEGFLAEYRRYREQGFGVLTSLGIAIYIYASLKLLVKLYNNADLIITVSESFKKQLKNYGVRQKIFVVRNGINVNEINLIEYNGPKVYDAVFVGRHSPQKGVLHVIDAWREIVKKVPNATIVLIGYCTEDMKRLIRSKIKQYKLEENIILRGVVPRKELILTMKKSKFLLFPSLEESFALVVGEALACGLPVVCYDIPVIREIYRVEAVLVCPTGNVKCLVDKSLELILNEKLREELSTKAQNYMKKFNWEETAEEEFRLYHLLVD